MQMNQTYAKVFWIKQNGDLVKIDSVGKLTHIISIIRGSAGKWNNSDTSIKNRIWVNFSYYLLSNDFKNNWYSLHNAYGDS